MMKANRLMQSGILPPLLAGPGLAIAGSLSLLSRKYNCHACPRLCRLVAQIVLRANSIARPSAGIRIVTSSAMIPTTTSSSTSVKPARLRLLTAGNSTSVNPRSLFRRIGRSMAVLLDLQRQHVNLT